MRQRLAHAHHAPCANDWRGRLVGRPEASGGMRAIRFHFCKYAQSVVIYANTVSKCDVSANFRRQSNSIAWGVNGVFGQYSTFYTRNTKCSFLYAPNTKKVLHPCTREPESSAEQHVVVFVRHMLRPATAHHAPRLWALHHSGPLAYGLGDFFLHLARRPERKLHLLLRTSTMLYSTKKKTRKRSPVFGTLAAGAQARAHCRD